MSGPDDADDEPTPPRRARSHWGDERRVEVGRQRREPDSAPVYVDDPGTGVVDGDELRAVREKRPTPLRLSMLEAKADTAAKSHAELLGSHLALTTTVGELGRIVGDVAGQLKVLPKLVENLEKAVERIGDGQRDEQRYRRDVKLKIIGGAIALFTTGVGAHWLLAHLGIM